MPSPDFERDILDLAARARAASQRLSEIDTVTKDAWLHRLSERLEDSRDSILAANALDLEEAASKNVPEPLVNRLALLADRWSSMIQGLKDVAALEDRLPPTPNSLETTINVLSSSL